MRIKIIIAWSWKKINCSIRGEALSCKPKNPHVAIFYGNIWFHSKILNLIHYSVTIELNSKFMMWSEEFLYNYDQLGEDCVLILKKLGDILRIRQDEI